MGFHILNTGFNIQAQLAKPGIWNAENFMFKAWEADSQRQGHWPQSWRLSDSNSVWISEIHMGNYSSVNEYQCVM